MQRHIMTTPWGDAQDARALAEGITFYSTASHGGYHLSQNRLAQMPHELRQIATWAGPGWYEEDCDWALIALAFAQYFDDLAIVEAIETVQRSTSITDAVHWLNTTPTGSALKLRADRWRKDHAKHYRKGSMSTGGNGWLMIAERVDGRATMRLQIADPWALPQPFTEEQARAAGRILELAI